MSNKDNYEANIFTPVSIIKAAPWDDINFRFKFCDKVVYPTDHDFFFFRVFRKII